MATHSSILAWKKSMDRGAWWAVVHGVAMDQTQLSMHTCIYIYIYVCADMCVFEDMCVCVCIRRCVHFPVALVVKNLPANAGDIRDVGSIPGLGRSPGEWHGNPLQYSCLENPVDKRGWWATVHGVSKSRTQLK